MGLNMTGKMETNQFY